MTKIEKHEKAIRILEAIDHLTNRIWSNEKSISMSRKNEFGGIFEHYTKRVEIDRNIKARLQNYYNNSFKTPQ
jgi:uncharacterized protein with ParB-like and HNH nuclease domain